MLTALYAASPPGTGIQFHLYASPAIRAPLARYANLRVADDVVPELDTLGRASRHTNIHRTMARRRAGHYLQGSRTSLLSAQSYLFRDYRLVVSVSLPGSPGESLAPGGVAAAARRHPGHAARRRLPVPFVDGGGPDQLGLRAARPAPANRRRHPAHLRRRARAARPGDRPGHAPAHRPPRHRPGQSGRRPANRASPDVGARLPAALRAVERRQPDRRPLPGHAAVPLPVPALAGRARARRRATLAWAFLKAARATTNATSYMARFLPDLQERKADWDIVLKAMDDGQQLVDLNLQLALFAEPHAVTRAEQAARAIFRARGFELSSDTMMMTRPHRLAADDALGAIPRRSAAHEARHHQDLGERGAPGAARRRVAGHGHAGASVRRAAAVRSCRSTSTTTRRATTTWRSPARRARASRCC